MYKQQLRSFLDDYKASKISKPENKEQVIPVHKLKSLQGIGKVDKGSKSVI